MLDAFCFCYGLHIFTLPYSLVGKVPDSYTEGLGFEPWVDLFFVAEECHSLLSHVMSYQCHTLSRELLSTSYNTLELLQ